MPSAGTLVDEGAWFYTIPMLLITLLLALHTQAEVVTGSLPAPSTDESIRTVGGPHLTFVDDSVATNGLLLLSLAGTNSVPKDFSALDSMAARQGYTVLALDYSNTVISTHCRKAKDADCFDRFRGENFSGKDLLPAPLNVDQANSIEHRLKSALAALVKKDPAHWSKFVDKNGEPIWEKIVVVGHSQGSGHATYLGYQKPLKGVLALAGPQDVFENGEVAGWLKTKGKTPPSRYSFLLHEKDFFGVNFQLSTARTILRDPAKKPRTIEASPGDCTDQVYVSQLKVSDPHMSVIQPQYEKVWKCLLERAARPNSPATAPAAEEKSEDAPSTFTAE